MSGLDAALLVLLFLGALRGLWRGFLRECFGFAGLVLGLVVATRFADDAARLVSEQIMMPATASLGAAFVGLFVLVHTSFTISGLLGDRLVGTPVTRLLNGAGGGLFGLAKGALVLSFVLLFLKLFPVVAGFDERIIASPVANPMASAAATALRLGWQAPPEGPGEA